MAAAWKQKQEKKKSKLYIEPTMSIAPLFSPDATLLYFTYIYRFIIRLWTGSGVRMRWLSLFQESHAGRSVDKINARRGCNDAKPTAGDLR